MFIAQAYNGDLDAAVDGFFDGTMESRVAAYDAGALDGDGGELVILKLADASLS